jgi:hypothetical protein
MKSYLLAAAVPLVVQAVFFARWLHCRMRDDEIQRAFVRDIARNHLPHVYSALRQIAEHSGITLEEPPLVRYVEFSNGAGNSSPRSSRLD